MIFLVLIVVPYFCGEDFTNLAFMCGDGYFFCGGKGYNGCKEKFGRGGKMVTEEQWRAICENDARYDGKFFLCGEFDADFLPAVL